MPRRAAVLALLALSVIGLGGCRKPVPQITVFADRTSVQIHPAFYSQAGGPTRTFASDVSAAPSISLIPGGRLHIDVPRQVSHSWVVVAVTLDSGGKSTPLAGIAPAEVLRDRYSVTLSTAAAGLNDFYVQIAQLRGSAQAGGWIFHVQPRI